MTRNAYRISVGKHPFVWQVLILAVLNLEDLPPPLPS
jgi:hypothetical protein